jgi:hypothetical protein
MVQPVPAVSIARLRSIWDEHVRPSARRALAALVCAVFFVMAHVARLGTPAARLGAAAALAVTLLAIAARTLIQRRRRADPRRVIEDTVIPLDPALGAATLRALTLLDRVRVDDRAGSPALAALHLDRLLGRVSPERLGERASRAAVRWASAGLAFSLLSVGVVIVEPFRVVEGLDVAVAQGDDAPLRLAWLDDVVMGATPPDYLHQSGSDVRAFRATAQPRGTTLTVRGRPLHDGRRVVLTDGTVDVPFVDDGAGGIIARWTVLDSTTLYVAATFGRVRVRQRDEQAVTSIPDETPRVTVEGAPRTVRLLDEPSIPIHYEATDDHGLREVDLVLRAGTREERRVLSHPAADVLVDRGGYEIQARDSFFKKTYTPVEITVEARDNDLVSGPKWGRSAPIVIIPPQVGEPEARRYAALLKARDALTDLVAFRLAERAPPTDKAKAHVAREAEEQAKVAKAVQDLLGGTYGGLTIRGVFVSLARGQIRRMAKALDAEKAAPVAAKHQKLLDESESALLAFDAGIRMIGDNDTRTIAKRLADVADEAAAGFAAAPTAPDARAALGRIDAAVMVLEGGGKQMLGLGDLGLDLGEIVGMDLRRVARAREAKDLPHAELAARDLAARLRKPNPSFMGGGGKGHGGGSGGVESGGAPSGADAGDPSEADQEAAETARELEELAREHASKIGEVEEALERAVSNEELDHLKGEAKQHAEALREAVKKLPSQRGHAGSAESAAAAAREEAEAMAGALEGGRPRDAVDSGKRAVDKAAEAQRLGEQAFFPEDKHGKEAAAAKPTLERELAWAQDALDKLRRAASERAKGDLQKHGKSEKSLAEKARDLMKKGEGGDRSMPQEMLDRLQDAEQAMREAEKALHEGNGEKGLKLQWDAQRFLEMARGEREQGNEREGADHDDGKEMKGKTDIPGKDAHKGPEEFRKRVLKGLGGSSDPRLREAVKRYAEGLLK